MKQTADNNRFLSIVKRIMNKEAYKCALTITNEIGETEARKFMYILNSNWYQIEEDPEKWLSA